MGGGSSREMVVGGDSVHKILLVCWKDEASLSNISPVYPLENVPWRSAKDKMNWHWQDGPVLIQLILYPIEWVVIANIFLDWCNISKVLDPSCWWKQPSTVVIQALHRKNTFTRQNYMWE